ncbi:hypothetical protein A6302_04252 [Methylobrevis pamukkalensis]|uniref:Uncharacterized protein n=1 Tax=Methylobrevis pamukkalensis TaxID=1439726 RepID=A0A1E3GWL9_9HYPH|nr:hypothetical protein A6302_04252 [Methylobrevis pamukkalensis]
MPRLEEASHWPLAIDSTQPRQISARKEAVHRISATPAASQAGTLMPNRPRPKKARNSCIRSGVPWNSSM